MSALVRKLAPVTALAALCSMGCAEDGPPFGPVPDPTTPPTVVYREILAVPGYLPYREPWSPEGHVVVFDSREGLHAVDLDHSAASPRRLTQQPVFYVAWSPDGKWLVGQQKVDPRSGLERLLAIPIDGSGEIELVRDWMEHVFWGSNGRLYYWRGEELRSVSPPLAWRFANATPFPVVDHFTLAERSFLGDNSMWAIRVRTYRDREDLAWIPAPDARSEVTIGDEFPNSSRLLLALRPVREGSSLGKIIGDEHGNFGAYFPSTSTPVPPDRFLFSFDPHSVSADGRFLAGSTFVEDGHTTFEARLHLADVEGRWVTPISPATDAIWPSLSRHGMLVAFQSLDDLVHVGELEIAWPR